MNQPQSWEMKHFTSIFIKRKWIICGLKANSSHWPKLFFVHFNKGDGRSQTGSEKSLNSPLCVCVLCVCVICEDHHFLAFSVHNFSCIPACDNVTLPQSLFKPYSVYYVHIFLGFFPVHGRLSAIFWICSTLAGITPLIWLLASDVAAWLGLL